MMITVEFRRAMNLNLYSVTKDDKRDAPSDAGYVAAFRSKMEYKM